MKTSNTSKLKANENEHVSVNVGFIKFENDNLRKCRGRTMPVKVPITADRKTILERAVKKHASHYKDVHTGLEYTLLYPDNREIVHLPGTTEDFVLKKYKADLGRNYNRITIFIATKADYILSQIAELGECIEPNSPENCEWDQSDDNGAHCSLQVQGDKIQSYTVKNKTSNDATESINSEANKPSTSTSVGHYAECPTCFELFPIHSIAEHADQCVDVWIGEVENSQTEIESDTDPLPLTMVGNTSSGVTKNLRDMVKQIADVHVRKEEPKRINVRRKHFWIDFKLTKEKWNIDPGTPVRIVLLGEPAVDDGGPKREFLSGKITYNFQNINLSYTVNIASGLQSTLFNFMFGKLIEYV